jgi:dolichyl-phosphate beta-glucosyltransferase
MQNQISLIIPVYNNKKLASENVKVLFDFLGQTGRSFEIILVDDSSVPAERITADDFSSPVTILTNEANRGKGYSVKRGMLAACGACRLFTDIDLPYELSFISESLTLIEGGQFHFVAGDRTDKQSACEVAIPFTRQLATRTLRRLVRFFLVHGVVDSQCGFKAFSGELAAALFPLLTINKFGFDVEIFYLLAKYGVPIKRLPVRFVRQGVSSVNPLTDGLVTGFDVLRIPLKWRRGRYASDKLCEFRS